LKKKEKKRRGGTHLQKKGWGSEVPVGKLGWEKVGKTSKRQVQKQRLKQQKEVDGVFQEEGTRRTTAEKKRRVAAVYCPNARGKSLTKNDGKQKSRKKKK